MADRNQDQQGGRQQGGADDGRQQNQQDQNRRQQGGADNDRQNNQNKDPQRGGQR